MRNAVESLNGRSAFLHTASQASDEVSDVRAEALIDSTGSCLLCSPAARVCVCVVRCAGPSPARSFPTLSRSRSSSRTRLALLLVSTREAVAARLREPVPLVFWSPACGSACCALARPHLRLSAQTATHPLRNTHPPDQEQVGAYRRGDLS